MNRIWKILTLTFTAFYLFLAVGVIVFETFCKCSGELSVSLFVETATCEENGIHNDDCCSSENDCKSCETANSQHSCGCESPTISYLKLTDHFCDTAGSIVPLINPISLLYGETITPDTIIPEHPKLQTAFYDYSPPDNPLVGRNLINFIEQRKIALFA